MSARILRVTWVWEVAPSECWFGGCARGVQVREVHQSEEEREAAREAYAPVKQAEQEQRKRNHAKKAKAEQHERNTARRL